MPKKRLLPPSPVFVLRSDNMGSVYSLSFANDTNNLLAGTVTGSVYRWNLHTNRISFDFKVSTDPVTTLHHVDDNTLITQDKGGILKLWNTTNTGYELKKTIKANHSSYCHSDLIDNTIVVYPDEKNTIRGLSLKEDDCELFKLVSDLDEDIQKLGNVTCLKSIHIRGQNYIIAGYENDEILTWDIRSSKIVDTTKITDNPLAIAYDSIANHGIVGAPEGNLIPFEYKSDSLQMNRLPDIPITNPGINCIRIRPDKQIFATGGWDSRIRIFSWTTFRSLAVLSEHKKGGIMDIAYSNGIVSIWNAPIMAAAGMDGQITLWDLYNQIDK